MTQQAQPPQPPRRSHRGFSFPSFRGSPSPRASQKEAEVRTGETRGAGTQAIEGEKKAKEEEEEEEAEGLPVYVGVGWSCSRRGRRQDGGGGDRLVVLEPCRRPRGLWFASALAVLLPLTLFSPSGCWERGRDGRARGEGSTRLTIAVPMGMGDCLPVG